MHKIRPLWRFIFFFILLAMTVYNSNMMAMDWSYRSFFGFAISASAAITWVFLCVNIKYDDPLRGIYEKISEAEEKASAAVNASETDMPVRSATVSSAADPELVSVLKDISVSLEKIAKNMENKK